MIDKSRMLDNIEAFPKWVAQGFELGSDIKVEKPVSRVLSMGMGGSGVAGLLLRTYLREASVPVDAVQSPELPNWADKDTLAFIASYSGETREALEVYRAAQRKFCKIITVTSGGKLAKLAISDSKPRVRLPEGLPPRASLPFLFFPLLRILQDAALITDQQGVVANTVKILQNPEYKERGEDLAGELRDKVTLIYATPFMAPVAYRMKCQINENAKAPAFCNVIPELTHNEVEGFLNTKADYHIIMIREDNPGDLVGRNFRAVKTVLRKRCKVTEIAFKESDRLSKLFSAIYLGDWASYFLGIKYDTDPTPTPMIREIKKHASALFG